jgi:signal transduction histidine kinase
MFRLNSYQKRLFILLFLFSLSLIILVLGLGYYISYENAKKRIETNIVNEAEKERSIIEEELLRAKNTAHILAKIKKDDPSTYVELIESSPIMLSIEAHSDKDSTLDIPLKNSTEYLHIAKNTLCKTLLHSSVADIAIIEKEGEPLYPTHNLFSSSDIEQIGDYPKEEVVWNECYAFYKVPISLQIPDKSFELILKSKNSLNVISDQITKLFWILGAMLIPLTLLISYLLSTTYSKLVSDIERKEQVLAQERKLSEIGGLLTFISHQWRQPLNIITTTMMEIRSLLYNKNINTSEIENLLDKNENVAMELSNMLELTKSYYQPFKDREFFTLDSVLGATIELLNSRAANISITKDIDRDIVIKGNKSELIQSLLSVINNSLDAFEERGIKEKKLSIKGEKIDKNIKITIIDNAGGIDEEIKKDMFRKYTTTKGKKGGTGIGLYFAQMIIKDMFGGKIEANSIEDGTTVVITLKNQS